MFGIKSVTVLFLIIVSVSHCQRRVKDGLEVTNDRKYMVYLVKAPKSESVYDFWMCGGAIVSNLFVITSAACVEDVEFIYVIAGYKNYIVDADIETDECTKTMKKKAIYTCSPKGYELKYGELDYWSFIDIALVKVDSAFDFNDDRYEKLCSYKPVIIDINYEEKYQEPGTDALVLGWGHTKGWRLQGDKKNYNERTLKYAPTLLMDKKTCVEHYKDYANMSLVIETYMICSLGKGNIDDAGKPILPSLPLQNGCTSQQQKLLGFEGLSCEQRDSGENYDDDETRRQNTGSSNKTNNDSESDFNETDFRRNGICQNDHGGPLVTWSGAREILIGVASVFKVSNEFECMGPYLYTSTVCTGMFLDCILNDDQFETRRSDVCDRPTSERGYDVIERTISWNDYPDGPENNDNIGRMPKEKFSGGLKYLTNNNEPPRESYTENTNVENLEVTKYESNNMYLGNLNPDIISNAPKESLKINERYPENKRISGMEGFTVIDQSPGKQSFPVNDRYPGQQLYQGNEGYPANDRYPANQSFSANQMHPEIGQNPMKVPSNIALRPQQPLRN